MIDAALELLNEHGLDAVTIREVARRMRVNVNTVSFQVGTKARLLGLMSDAVLAHLSLKDLPDDGFQRAEEILRRYRNTLLTYRDGARLTAGNTPFEEHTRAFTEELVTALSIAGVPDKESTHGMWALFYFLLGITQEQQATQTQAAPEEVPPADKYPTLYRLHSQLFSPDFDARYDFGVTAILTHLRQNITTRKPDSP
ncbi:TetR family transcriptional regulator [Microbacterium resistens]|uniref:TetR/AcrR family transcriptional regulator C-terminal domain-containing protein n=1 Tax=Microbacterium resistens TaxID=156977 RepID=UPI001C58C521|nr:TetR/AcrR family transcriptional regulator C-terminal domain-containing protein [Microbacterium resistens]MBW1639033.1 TetR family transcriptional regulator [Microbacterium resistens]